jgi:hypothetical protein
MGALSTPKLRPKLKHWRKDDFTMRAGECGETDYDTFMTLVVNNGIARSIAAFSSPLNAATG